MEIILILAVLLSIVGVSYASTADLHSCTECNGVGSEEYGMMQISAGKKTVFNPRGKYWTHTSCSGFLKEA